MQKIFKSTSYLLIFLASFSMVRCNQKAKAADDTENVIVVKVQPVSTAPYKSVLKYSGLVASTSEARLSFKIGGVISKIYVKEGDHVERGQVLATLDLTEINAQVQQASQNTEKIQRDVNRVRNLYNDTVATLEQLQNASTQLSVAQEGLRIARFNQQYAQIRATESGTIVKKLMNEGEVANSGSAVFFFNGTSNSDWVIRFGVSDKDWAVLQKGDKAEVTLDAYPGRTFTGIITEQAQGADPASGTYEIEVKVIPNGTRFAAGLFANIKLQPIAPQQVTMVPIEAITEADDKTGYIYTVNADNKTVTKNKVTIAFLEKDSAAISSGLDNIHQVITEGVGYLTEKSAIKVVQ